MPAFALTPLLLFAVAADGDAPPAVVVDDADTEHMRATLKGKGGNGYQAGWLPFCLGANMGPGTTGMGYHWDVTPPPGSLSRYGAVEVEVSPDIPKAGCWAVSERHPGRTYCCTKYLAHDAPVTVHDAYGVDHPIKVDLSVRGGRWNSLGEFALKPGQARALTAGNNGGNLTCETQCGKCAWVVDAFRFEWRGEACAGAAAAAEAALAALPVPAGCAGFAANLSAAVAQCPARNCSAFAVRSRAQGCAAAADGFARRFPHAVRCLAAGVGAELGVGDGGRARAEAVEALVSCPAELALAAEKGEEEKLSEELTAAKQTNGALDAKLTAAETKAKADLLALQAAALEKRAALDAVQSEVTIGDVRAAGFDVSQAAAWDGNCSHFDLYAVEVAAACDGARCCADVAGSEACQLAASGLHVLFPPEALGVCAERAQFRRLRGVRHAMACALQGEVHEVLYGERWAPECNPFAAMQPQQQPGPRELGVIILQPAAPAAAASGGGAGGQTRARWLMGGAGLVAGGCLVAGVAAMLWLCRRRRGGGAAVTGVPLDAAMVNLSPLLFDDVKAKYVDSLPDAAPLNGAPKSPLEPLPRLDSKGF